MLPTGKRILILERGPYLPREQANWDSKTVFVDGKYQVDETWYGARMGPPFKPGLHRYVGGNSKVYGAALLRLRERDFEEIQHPGRRVAGLAGRIRCFRALLHRGRDSSFMFTAKPARIPNEPRRTGEFSLSAGDP